MNRYSLNTIVGLVGVGLCLVFTAAAEPRSSKNSFGIIPMPLSIEAKKEHRFEITGDTSIVYLDEKSEVSAEYLQSRIAAAVGLKLAVQKSEGMNAIILKVAPEIIEFP